MSAKEQLKQHAAVEKEKLKQMSRKDKVWYIWEYYKIHMLAVLIMIAVFYTIGSSIYRSTFDTELYCMYLNNRSGEELNTDILTVDFHEYMGFTEKQLITTESSFISYGDNSTELSYASMAKVSALVASRELDIMIGDTANFEHYTALGGCADLEEVLPADVFELVKDSLCYGVDDTGAEHAYGITLDGTKFAEDSHLSMDSTIFSIVSNSSRIENSVALIRYIFQE